MDAEIGDGEVFAVGKQVGFGLVEIVFVVSALGGGFGIQSFDDFEAGGGRFRMAATNGGRGHVADVIGTVLGAMHGAGEGVLGGAEVFGFLLGEAEVIEVDGGGVEGESSLTGGDLADENSVVGVGGATALPCVGIVGVDAEDAVDCPGSLLSVAGIAEGQVGDGSAEAIGQAEGDGVERRVARGLREKDNECEGETEGGKQQTPTERAHRDGS